MKLSLETTMNIFILAGGGPGATTAHRGQSCEAILGHQKSGNLATNGRLFPGVK